MQRFHAMFVHAHPDDESSKGAGTMARYVKEGHRVSVVTCTDGSAGDILNPAMDRPGVRERMPEIRREELARALEILGVRDHWWLGYRDSGWVEGFDGDGSALAPDVFYNASLDEAAERLVRVIRAERPHVVVTYPPDGGYPHPDHIRCHEVSVAAFDAASDPTRFPDAGDPWQPQKLYYVSTFTRVGMQALHDALLDRGMESPFAEWLERWPEEDDVPVTTRVDISEFLELRNQALIAHATQIDPEGPWFVVPDELRKQVYPWEDFELARSLVETEPPEESLFTGLSA